MTEEEEDYEGALRRIREAEKTGTLELDLSGLLALNRIPPELERLTSLQALDINGRPDSGIPGTACRCWSKRSRN